ncbi:MAG: ABC transporter substrate-binding protein, partial [bacterium]
MPKTVATPAIRFFARGLLQSACIALAIAVAIAGCSRKPEPIWIGAVGMLHDADASEDNLRGMRIAIDEANQTGGIRGRRVELRILRDSGLGELAARVAQEFVADERILAVMGHEFSSAMIAAAPVYNGKLAAVSTATSPQLSGISPWVFRVLASDSALAVVEARAFIAKGWRRVAML